MEAKDLRIGNIIQGKSDIKKRYTAAQLHDIEFAHLFEGVPITEEWLNNLGLRNDSTFYGIPTTEYFIGNFWIHIVSSDLCQLGLGLRPPSWQQTFISYVHQLQNLYFALTGKELELNSKQIRN